MTPLLVAVTDATRALDEHLAAYEELSVLGTGLSVMVRLPGRDAGDFVAWARAFIAAGHAVSIAERLDVARALGVRSVHLGEASVDTRDARTLMGDGAWISRACHAPTAPDPDADAVLLSPIFASPGKGAPLGLSAIAPAAQRKPVIALGGVTASNAAACLASGAAGVAAIRACLDEPRALVAALLGEGRRV